MPDLRELASIALIGLAGGAVPVGLDFSAVTRDDGEPRTKSELATRVLWRFLNDPGVWASIVAAGTYGIWSTVLSSVRSPLDQGLLIIVKLLGIGGALYAFLELIGRALRLIRGWRS